jgi:pilus assembly protein CpaB
MTRSSSLQFAGGGRAGILLALVLAALAGALVFIAIQSGGGEKSAVQLAAPSTSPVLRANRNIPARTQITAEMVEVVQLPQGAILAGALASPQAVVGTTASVPIYAGEQIIPSKLITAPALTANSLAFIVPEGRRAMALGVDKVMTAGGLLRPGDRVDLILLLEVTTGTGPQAQSETRAITFAQNIEVLAVEQSLQRRLTTEAGVRDGTLVDQPDANPAATVVTFAVTPEEAQEFFLADQKGSIRLTVRGSGDEAIVPVAGSTVEGLTP